LLNGKQVVYKNYPARTKPDRKTNLLRASLVVLAAVLLAAGVVVYLRWGKVDRPISEVNGIKQVSTVQDAHLAIYDGTSWSSRFWTGVDLGATLPGHAPGELAPTKEDYLRWFTQMKEMNTDVLRVYTILSPEFYQALEEFNSTREDPLWLVQGIWSPEEELIGEDEKGRDAYSSEITEKFQQEITDTVQVVHGDAYIAPRYGHVGGQFDRDVSEYMLGWMVGTEWYPYAVKVTDDANADTSPFSGKYFKSTKDATPFESWLASMLEVLATKEMEYGWQHPVSLTNWLTTDPLSHPDEANEKEDLVSVDPMHLEPTSSWLAGYFASFHVYPYYPDFLRYEDKYQNYRNAEGNIDPYAGYLMELRAHHKDVPLVVSEFGVPSSRGMAHIGPLDRNQGMHTEEEQGKIDRDMLADIQSEGYDGGFLFSWQDEWFKFTWNTKDLNIPEERRPMWANRLTNEQNFGVIANDPGKASEAIYLDGKTEDWENRTDKKTQSYPDFDLSVAHDEAYLYLLLKKKEGDWDLSKDELNVGFGTLPDGSQKADKAPGLIFPGGIQFLLQMKGEADSHLWVNSAYDHHTWLYGETLHMIPEAKGEKDPQAGEFVPWKLALSRPLVLPQSEREIPFEDFEVGLMKTGITDPSDPEFDSLADWYAKGDVLEVRIPWMMLGYTDPSKLQVWDYPYKASEVTPVESDELRVYPAIRSEGQLVEVEPLSYYWQSWNEPNYHERKKQSYSILREAFKDKQLKPVP
jgi:hypothetical protein